MTPDVPALPTCPWCGHDDDCHPGIPTCRYCHDAIHNGDCCIECWRDLRELAIARDREWWSA